MKRAGNLWPQVIAFENLLEAARAAARGKRGRPDVASFLLNLEAEVLGLRRELLAGEYRPGAYRTFLIREPKARLISAAPFRDRVVHHALTRVLEPIFERRFLATSFACRKGYGTHRALELARAGCRRYPFVLKCDVRKYFPSIDHAILKELLARVVKCRHTLDLAGRIIDGSNEQEEVILHFPGDTLWTPLERPRGLPLGNQTSQFFANVYLNGMDHYVARDLRPNLYGRYVDDFLLFDQDKRRLGRMRRELEEYLGSLRLRMHPGKSRVYRTEDGVTFLGWRIFPEQARLVRTNVIRFRRRMRALEGAWASGSIEWKEISTRAQAWIAHAAHGDTWGLRRNIFQEYVFIKEQGRTGRSRGLLEQSTEEHPRV